MDCVVVCANAAEMDDYRAALSVFFPRNDEERKISEEALKDKPGYNEYGEMILDERRLRIAGRLSSASDFTGGMNKTIEGGPRKVEQPPVVLVSVTRRMVP